MRRAALVPVCVCASRSEKTLSHPDPAAWGHVVRNDGRDIHQENRSAGPGVRLRKPHYNFRQIERQLPVRLLDPA